MRRSDPLNDRQLAVLKQVAGGDELAAAEPATRRSAGALRDRGLLQISKRGGRWQAAITDAGRFYLEHGRHPEHPAAPTAALNDLPSPRRAAPDRAPRPRSPNVEAVDDHSQPSAARAERPPPHATAEVAERRRAAATKLLAELEAHPYHRKTIASPDETAKTEWRCVVDFAKRHGLVPAGKRLEKTSFLGELRIRLLDGEHPNTRKSGRGLPDVPIPTELHGLHPVVKAMQNDRGRLAMACGVRERCLLYFHGLAKEAVRRGHDVREHPIAPHHRNRITTYGRPGERDYSRREGELEIVVGGFSYTVRIDQQHPEAEDLERFRRLAVSIHGPSMSHGSRFRWADGKRQRVEHCVADLLRELERHAADARFEQVQRRFAWEDAMALAKQRATHARYAAVLGEQVANWRRARDLRQYCSALEQRVCLAEQTGEAVDNAKRWLSWAKEYAGTIDPLEALPATPNVELRPSDLEPFLDGWSPYGPEEYGRR